MRSAAQHKLQFDFKRRCRTGQAVGVGVVGYADDLILLAPSRHAAQILLQKCEQFCWDNNIQFSTHEDPSRSKSKALFVVGPRRARLP